MSILQVANVHLESTGNNRIEYSGSNTVDIYAGGVLGLSVNATSVALVNTDIGSTVQGYDAGLAYLDGLNFTDESTFKQAVNLEIGTDVQAYDVDTLKADTADVLTAGFTSTLDDDGTQSSGTYTPDPDSGLTKAIVNGGAFTLAPPTAASGETIHMQVLITNNASAGAITTSGFTFATGDSFDTTDGNDFLCYIDVINKGGTTYSTLNVRSLQ